MSWSELNNMELQAIRRLLFLEVTEAAELIGGVTPRTWQRWEDGTRKVPDDIDMEMYGLSQIRGALIDVLLDDKQAGQDKFQYFHKYEDFKNSKAVSVELIEDGFVKSEKPEGEGTKVDWRIYQSSVSFVFAEIGDIELVP